MTENEILEKLVRVAPGKNGVNYSHLIIWHPEGSDVWPDGTYHSLCGENLPAPEVEIPGGDLAICEGCLLGWEIEDSFYRASKG